MHNIKVNQRSLFVIMVIILISVSTLSAQTPTYNVTFMNNKENTQLGLVKFNSDGTDYESVLIWSDKVKDLELEPARYGLTEATKAIYLIDDKVFVKDVVTDFMEFTVKDRPLVISFQSKKI